jgi:hypothetical protein
LTIEETRGLKMAVELSERKDNEQVVKINEIEKLMNDALMFHSKKMLLISEFALESESEVD